MNTLLKPFYQRIKRQKTTKYILVSLIVSFVLLLVTHLIVWLTGVGKPFFISVPLSICSGLIYFIIVYKHKVNPSMSFVAQQIDKLGLEERVLTMVEMEGSESFIAKKQREDTLKALKSIDYTSIKQHHRKQSILCSMSLILATAILALSLVFPNAHETLTAWSEPVKSISVSIEGSGFVIDYSKSQNQSLIEAVAEKQKKDDTDRINGKEIVPTKQFPTVFSSRILVSYHYTDDFDATMVLDGANFSEVSYEIKSNESHTLMALPYNGYVFIGWSDGYTSPFREIDNYSMSFTAMFDEVSALGEEKDSSEDGEPSDSDSGSGNQSSNSNNGNGNSSGSTDGNEDGAKGSAANQVINGETYYGDIFNQSYQEAIERVKNNPNLTEAQKKAISDYFESIRKN